MMLGAGISDASSSPAVTDPATVITSTSADLNGIINPGGLDTFWEFQWGTTTAYGQNTTPSGPITGTNANSVLAPIAGLQPGTTYHFRLVAVQGAGGASGQPTLTGGTDETFTTPAPSPSRAHKHKHSHASLRSRTLTVHHGDALIRWRCSGSSGAMCKATIALSASRKVGGKIETVSCGGATLLASTGRHPTVRAHLKKSCLALVQNARHHRLGASLKAHFSQGTGRVKTKVTLVLG